MRKPHYAWLVCLGGALSLFTVMGLGVNIFTLYQPEIISVNGFTNAQGSWITTTRSLFILAALLCVNQLCAKIGLRLVMTLGMLLVGLSCLCFGLAKTFPAYCLAAALTGLGYCFGGMVPLSLVITNWFDSRRGFALGLASAGSGVATIFAPPIVTALIRSHGLKAAFFWLFVQMYNAPLRAITAPNGRTRGWPLSLVARKKTGFSFKKRSTFSINQIRPMHLSLTAKVANMATTATAPAHSQAIP